jgi:phospholipase/carboxylesterase
VTRALGLALFAALASCRSGELPAPAPREAPPAPSPPAPVEPADPFAHAGPLAYIEITTAGADAQAPLPMIVAIHGLGDDPRDFAGLLADFDRPARVILPRALDEHEEGGFSWFPIRARDADVEALAAGIVRASDALAAGSAELARTRPTVGRPIVTGFSQGGMLSFALAVRNPDLVGAAIPVGGWLPPPLWPAAVDDASSYPKIVALHGDQDAALKIALTRECVAHLRGLGLAVELREHPGVGHAITPAIRDELHALLRASLPSTGATTTRR